MKVCDVIEGHKANFPGTRSSLVTKTTYCLHMIIIPYILYMSNVQCHL